MRLPRAECGADCQMPSYPSRTIAGTGSDYRVSAIRELAWRIEAEYAEMRDRVLRSSDRALLMIPPVSSARSIDGESSVHKRAA